MMRVSDEYAFDPTPKCQSVNRSTFYDNFFGGHSLARRGQVTLPKVPKVLLDRLKILQCLGTVMYLCIMCTCRLYIGRYRCALKYWAPVKTSARKNWWMGYPVYAKRTALGDTPLTTDLPVWGNRKTPFAPFRTPLNGWQRLPSPCYRRSSNFSFPGKKSHTFKSQTSFPVYWKMPLKIGVFLVFPQKFRSLRHLPSVFSN